MIKHAFSKRKMPNERMNVEGQELATEGLA